MPRALLALCVVIVAGGCPGVLAPQMDPVRWRCEALSSPDLRVRDDALAFLEHEFADEYWVKYKHLTEAHRAELATCLPRLARLLEDPDPAVRRRARRTLGGMTRHTCWWPGRIPPGSDEVIRAVVRDAERLWNATDLPPEEAEDRPNLLVRDLAILTDYGPRARAALPLAETILAAPPLAVTSVDQPGRPGPPPPPCAEWPEDVPTPLVQDAAAELAWSIADRRGSRPRVRRP